MFLFTFSRFTSLTSTSRGKSASRSLRRWARATVCQCSKHVSDITRVLLSLLQLDWTSYGVMFLLCTFLPQRFVKWVWGFATTWGLRSSHSSTAGEVSVRWACADEHRWFLTVCRTHDQVVLSSSGCQLLVYPGAFNMTTGPAHWELLQRGRWDWRVVPLKNSYPSQPNIF